MRRLLKVRKGICIAASAVVIAATVLLPLLAPRRRPDTPGALTSGVLSTEYSPVSDYCNFPDENRIAEEGTAVRAAAAAAQPLELVSVTVVLRHGDRFHMSSSRLGDIASPAVSCRLTAPTAADGDDDAAVVRRFIDDMDRMVATGSARWPLPPYPNVSACAPGHMSPAGVRQQLRSGRQLRAAYAAARLNLSSIRTVSTTFERTYQSALAFLHGLNPRLDWPRLTIERAADTRFCLPAAIGGSCACPYAEVLDREARAEAQAALRGRDAAHATFAERAALVLGRRGGAAPYPWEGAFDFLSQFACRRLRPPCGGGGECFRDEDISALWQHLQVYSRRLYAGEPFVRKCRIEAHPLLSAIGARLTAFARLQSAALGGAPSPPSPSDRQNDDDHPARMLVYSAHDVTVTPLAVALGVPLSGRPPYASRLVFEQYSDSGRGGSRAAQKRRRSRHYVRVLYNGVDVTRHMHFCSAGLSVPAADAAGTPTILCALDEFASFASRRNLGELGYRNWRDACRGHVTRATSRQPPTGDGG